MVISSETTWGALRALESLSQLIDFNFTEESEAIAHPRVAVVRYMYLRKLRVLKRVGHTSSTYPFGGLWFLLKLSGERKVETTQYYQLGVVRVNRLPSPQQKAQQEPDPTASNRPK